MKRVLVIVQLLLFVTFFAAACAATPETLYPSEYGFENGPKVKIGMTPEQVLDTLGQPWLIEKRGVTVWRYKTGGVCDPFKRAEYAGPGEMCFIDFDQGIVVSIMIWKYECDE